MMSWKVCTNQEYESPINSKPYYICATGKFIKDINALLSKVEDDGEEK